jgi:hypothetical protein
MMGSIPARIFTEIPRTPSLDTSATATAANKDMRMIGDEYGCIMNNDGFHLKLEKINFMMVKGWPLEPSNQLN